MHKKSVLTILLLCLPLIITTRPSFAGKVFIGITAEQSTLFISDKDTLADLAEMEDVLYFLPALLARSENKYFNQYPDWGYFLEFNIGYYNINKQVINGRTVNLNTSLSGLAWDLTPTLFYNFGSKERDQWGFKTGLGIGAGYLSVSGNVVLTGQAGQPLVAYDDNGYGFTVGVFFEATNNDLFVQIKGYGPDVVIGDNSLQLANIKITLGKSYKF
jgi:hypothetical protein